VSTAALIRKTWSQVAKASFACPTPSSTSMAPFSAKRSSLCRACLLFVVLCYSRLLSSFVVVPGYSSLCNYSSPFPFPPCLPVLHTHVQQQTCLDRRSCFYYHQGCRDRRSYNVHLTTNLRWRTCCGSSANYIIIALLFYR
jgi:hypothetical protein